MERRRSEFVAEIEKSRRSYKSWRRANVASVVATANAATPAVRRMWIRERAHSFWSTIEHLGDEQWKSHFARIRAIQQPAHSHSGSKPAVMLDS